MRRSIAVFCLVSIASAASGGVIGGVIGGAIGGEDHLDAMQAAAADRFRAGDVAGARDLYREIVAKRAAASDTARADLTALFDLGACHLRLGELGPARRCFARAVAGFEARQPGDELGLALALEGLAATLLTQEDPGPAQEHVARARALRAARYPPSHPQIARLDALAGRLADLDGRPDVARAAMERAKQAYRRIHGNVHPTVATLVRNFIDVELARGDRHAASVMAVQADYITREIYGPEAPERVTTLAALGRVAWAEGDFAGAATRYREALAILDAHGRTSLLEVVTCETELGRNLLATGRLDDAHAALRRAGEAYERAWWLAGQGLPRAAFMTSPYPLLAAAELLRDRPDAALRAWQALARHHGRSIRHSRWLSLLEPAERARRDSLQQRALTVSRRIEAAAAAGDLATVAGARAERSAIDTRLADLERVLRERVQTAGGFGPAELPTPAPGVARVGWLDVEAAPGGLRSWAWVVTAGSGPTWVPLPAGDAARDAAKALRMALAEGTGAASDVSALARRLDALRLAPLADHLRGVEVLQVVPGEVLAGVPPAVLVTPSGEYRHERHALMVSPWASPPDVIGAAAAEAPSETRGLLAVADPPFSRAQAAAMQDDDGAPMPAVSARGVMRAVVRGDRDQLHLLPRLPSTRREVADIAPCFGEAEVLLGADASEANLLDQQRDQRLGSYDVIHLATHALVDAQRPQRSALVLSQLDPEPDDGLLTTAEIAAGWRLRADLVTLSACETGLGRPTPGDGYLGFTQAFLQAGARNVLVSLWQVDDRATSLLMRRFYENLQRRGLDAAASLAEAQRWLRTYEVRGQAVFADPRDWGAFVLVGSD